jgi:MFS family permease
VWILDGLEVTIVGSIASRLTEPGSGVTMNAAQIGIAAAIYVAGACSGALLFGQLTDRFGRKKLFLLTLALYIGATVLTAFTFAPWYFFLMRFLTGMGIGGEYAAINSAIDELIPARNRGQVDIAINGSYWLGAAFGALVTVVLLSDLVPMALGWRLAFGLGGVIGLAILLVRRNVPESPRWLFIHGREQEAERIVDEIESEVQSEVAAPLPRPGGTIAVRQRKAIPFREIARTAIEHYPRRATLGLALFVGQAFLYNAVTFDLGTLLGSFFDVSSKTAPYFVAAFAFGNFLGPLLLGRLFDTVGRVPMISGTYFASSALTFVTGLLMLTGSLTLWTFMLLILLTFFVASAGASSAYLTVSEVFPMETRALAIALFYAIGTAVGGITGPALFGQLVESGQANLLATGFFIGAGVMLLGSVAELLLGVRAERQSLEHIARPLTAEEVEVEPQKHDELVEAERSRGLSAADRQRLHERDERVRQRTARVQERERAGLRRFRPGPGSGFYSPGMVGSATTSSRWSAVSNEALDEEIDDVARALRDRGEADRGELEKRVRGRSWGPGRFRRALKEAVEEGRVKRLSSRRYGPEEPREGTDERGASADR